MDGVYREKNIVDDVMFHFVYYLMMTPVRLHLIGASIPSLFT